MSCNDSTVRVLNPADGLHTGEIEEATLERGALLDKSYMNAPTPPAHSQNGYFKVVDFLLSWRAKEIKEHTIAKLSVCLAGQLD